MKLKTVAIAIALAIPSVAAGQYVASPTGDYVSTSPSGPVSGDLDFESTYDLACWDDILACAPESDAAPGVNTITGTNAFEGATGGNQTGGDLEFAAGIGTRQVTIDDYNNCAGDTVTVTIDGSANVLTEGVDWTAATDNATTCGSLATAIAGLSGVESASCTAAVARVRPANATKTVTLAEGDATCTTLTSGADGDLVCWADLDLNGNAIIGASSVASTGAVSSASVSATGAVSGASVSATGAVSGATVSATGNVSGGTVSSTGTITGVTEAAGTSSTAMASTAFVGTADTAIYDRVRSRGMNLVANGTALLKTNYNFSSLTYDGSQVPPEGGSGSFRTSSLQSVHFSGETIPVDAGKTYEGRGWVRGDATVSKNHFIGGAFFDIDGNAIFPQNHMYQASTTTTLAAPLTPGDTTITLTSAANWSNSATAGLRQLILWRWKNAQGFQYPVNTYSRYTTVNFAGYGSNGLYSVGGISGNVITLTEPWPAALGNPDDGAGTWPAGTDVSNANIGGTYKYFVAVTQPLQATWTEYRGTIGGVDTTGTNLTAKFPPGTAEMKIVILANYEGTPGGTSTQYNANLWVSEITPLNFVDLNNNILLERNGNFNLLRFGGTSASYPALKRNGATLEVRAATDASFAPLATSTLTSSVWIQAGATSYFEWAGRSRMFSTEDGKISLRNGASSFGVTIDVDDTANTMVVKNNGGTDKASMGPQADSKGSTTLINSASADITCNGSASNATGNIIPDGAFLVGVTSRITTALTGSTGYQIGVAADPDQYGVAATATQGTITNNSHATATWTNPKLSAENVLLTWSGGSCTAGVVRVVVHFIAVAAPTAN